MAEATATPEDSPVRAFLRDYGVLLVVGVAMAAALLAVGLFVFGDTELARSLIDRYGLYALFCILILEGAMLLYFAPSEALVPAGIALVADTTGEVAAVILVAVAGATVGQFLLFTFAKRAGREYLLDRPWFRVDESRLERFDGWFDRWGPVVVPVSNALLFTRGMLTVPAGFAEMRDWQFVALSALGSLVFQTWLALAALGLLGRL
jgi:membrane protein DedA with SNARE-associated domain